MKQMANKIKQMAITLADCVMCTEKCPAVKQLVNAMMVLKGFFVCEDLDLDSIEFEDADEILNLIEELTDDLGKFGDKIQEAYAEVSDEVAQAVKKQRVE